MKVERKAPVPVEHDVMITMTGAQAEALLTLSRLNMRVPHILATEGSLSYETAKDLLNDLRNALLDGGVDD